MFVRHQNAVEGKKSYLAKIPQMGSSFMHELTIGSSFPLVSNDSEGGLRTQF